MATCLIVSRLEVRRRRDALLLWSEQSPYAVAGLGGMRRPRAVVNGIPRPSPPTRWPPKANPASLSKRTQTSDVIGSGNEQTDTTIWYASFTPSTCIDPKSPALWRARQPQALIRLCL